MGLQKVAEGPMGDVGQQLSIFDGIAVDLNTYKLKSAKGLIDGGIGKAPRMGETRFFVMRATVGGVRHYQDKKLECFIREGTFEPDTVTEINQSAFEKVVREAGA